MQSIPSSNRNRNKPIKNMKKVKVNFLNTSLNIPKNIKFNFSPDHENIPNKIQIKKGNTIFNNENNEMGKKGNKDMKLDHTATKINKNNQMYPMRLVNKIEIDLMHHRIELEQKFRKSEINLNYVFPRNSKFLEINGLDDEDHSIESFPNICIFYF